MLLFVAIGASAASPQRVAYIINGGLGDLSFYDSGQAGIDRIRDEFGVQTRTIECGFDPASTPRLYRPRSSGTPTSCS